MAGVEEFLRFRGGRRVGGIGCLRVRGDRGGYQDQERQSTQVQHRSAADSLQGEGIYRPWMGGCGRLLEHVLEKKRGSWEAVHPFGSGFLVESSLESMSATPPDVPQQAPKPPAMESGNFPDLLIKAIGLVLTLATIVVDQGPGWRLTCDCLHHC